MGLRDFSIKFGLLELYDEDKMGLFMSLVSFFNKKRDNDVDIL